MSELFSPPPRRADGRESYKVPLVTIGIGAGGLLLSLGLCGVGSLLPHPAGIGTGPLNAAAIAIFVLSVLVLAIGVLMLVIVALAAFFRGR